MKPLLLLSLLVAPCAFAGYSFDRSAEHVAAGVHEPLAIGIE